MMIKVISVCISALVFLFCIVSVISAQKNAEANEDVLLALKAYDTAWNGKDKAAAEEILAPDYIYFTSKGGIWSRQYTLDFFSSPKYSLKNVERSEVKTYGNGNAITVSSRWKGTGSYDGKDFTDDQRCGQVFVKEKGRWKLLSEHCVQIEKKP